MNFRNLSSWSIRNPIVPIVLFVALVLVGIVSFMRMDVDKDPDIEFPVVIVTISQPGAAPTEIETQITQRIEAAVRSISGVANISSTASEGTSTTAVEFNIGEDINGAVSEVKNAVDQIRGELPDGILEPQVIKQATSSEPIAFFAVQGEDQTLEQLSWFVDDTVARRLVAIDGMASVARIGGVSREIVVTVNPQRMQALGVTASEVNITLRALNTNAAGGRFDIGGSKQSVRVLGNAKNAYELSQTEIAIGAGRTIKLADIADVTDSYAEVTELAKYNDKPVVAFSMARARGASDVTVYDNAVKEMAAIAKDYPGTHFSPVFTSVKYTKLQYESSMASMVEGAILAVVVVFFFLRDWRATLIAAIAIPLSAIPTFWVIDLMGFSLNQLSLLALGLVAGVLVDDAIVEIENIVRHVRMGKTAYQASIDAADEIGLAVVATTFSIVAVFLPVGLMPGVSGQFFKNFGLTVVVAVLISLAVARMVTPMVAAYFLEAKGTAEHAGGRVMGLYLKVLHWSLDVVRANEMRAHLHAIQGRLLDWTRGTIAIAAILLGTAAAAAAANMAMGALSAPLWLALSVSLLAGVVGLIALRWLLAFATNSIGGRHADWYAFMGGRFDARLRDHRIWMMFVGLAALALTVLMFVTRPAEFFPDADSDFSQVTISQVPGTTLAQTDAMANRVAAIIRQQPETAYYFEDIEEGKASLLVTLKDGRKRTSQQYEATLTRIFQAIPDARVTFQSQQGGSGTGRAISVMLAGSNSELLEATAAKLVEQMKGLKLVVAPRVSGDLRRPEIIIKPRLDLAAQLGVSTAGLSTAIRIATIGDIDQNAAKFSLSSRQVPIRVRFAEAARHDASNIANLPVPTNDGGSVPLSRVAEISFGSGPTTIQRYNQERRVFVGADLAPGVIKGDATAAINTLPIMKNLPAGISNKPFGADKWQQDMLDNLAIALPSGILLVFAVLVLLYHRVISPLVNMGSLLLAPLGGLIALAIAGEPLSLPVFIGLLMLFGIVAKNSILLIDFAIEEMQAGTPKFDAIIEAGHKRAQPIVMTTVAMVAGMIPTALALSGDGAWRAPMGTVVIGGLALSTVLTLLIVPAAFSLADGFERRLGPGLRRMFLTYEPEHGAAARARDEGTVPAE